MLDFKYWRDTSRLDFLESLRDWIFFIGFAICRLAL